jgi:tellurite resistance protein
MRPFPSVAHLAHHDGAKEILMNLDIDLTPAQTLALTACMLHIAHVDGVQPSETALIRQFYESGREAGMPGFEEVEASQATAMSRLQQLPPSTEFNQALVTMCLMTGYADGALSDAERDTALGFGRSVGVSREAFDALLQEVRDSLLGSLAHLPDAQSVATLAREL